LSREWPRGQPANLLNLREIDIAGAPPPGLAIYLLTIVVITNIINVSDFKHPGGSS